MKNDIKQNTDTLISYLGGEKNIVSVTNCMTRLRVNVNDETSVNMTQLQTADDVIEIIHDRDRYYEIVVGPGKSKKYADQCRERGISAEEDKSSQSGQEWKNNKSAMRSRQKNSTLRTGLKTVGEIFVPLLPGTITAGLCAGFAALIAQVIPDYTNNTVWSIIYQLLTLVNVSFMTYLTAWAGYRAAERFGASPILGGMLGMITSLDGINTISGLIGLYDANNPLNSVLRAGKGGVLAVIVGVYLLSIVEKKIRSWMPESADVIFTPLLSLLACAIPYILIIMPIFGYISSGIAWFFSKLCMSESLIVRIIAGYISTALFLPLVAAGMHHGLVAIYTVQLQELGYVTLYPALAMAGAGQVGAAVALWIKAKKVGNQKLCSRITGALPAGVLGIGEPLIYGVTLPLGRPFLTAGLGAGFGGALVTAFEVASTTWGPSGLLGVFVMTAGPNCPVKSVLAYLAGLLVSYICSFIITESLIHTQDVLPENMDHSKNMEQDRKQQPDFEKVTTGQIGFAESFSTVHHGETILLGNPNEFIYMIKDPSGLHARPAGRLAEIVRGYDCEVTVNANERSASAKSPIDLMNLGAGQGSVLSIRAEGNQAQAALQAVKAFLKENL